MFAEMLLEDEKKSFLSLLEYLSLIDGEITEQEKQYLAHVAGQIGIDYTLKQTVQDYNLKQILDSFTSSLSKHIILMELVNIAFADKNYSINEKEGIRQIAQLLSISHEKLTEIENWVEEGFIWKAKGFNILTD